MPLTRGTAWCWRRTRSAVFPTNPMTLCSGISAPASVSRSRSRRRRKSLPAGGSGLGPRSPASHSRVVSGKTSRRHGLHPHHVRLCRRANGSGGQTKDSPDETRSVILVLGAGTQALLGLQLVIGLSSTFEELPTIWHVIHGFPLLAVALAPSSSLSLSSFIGLHGQG